MTTSAAVPESVPRTTPPLPDDPWPRTLYEEAWRQYSHEGAKVYTRTSVILGIHAGLLALVAALAMPLLALGESAGGRAPTGLGQIVFGVTLVVIGSFAMFVAYVWQNLTYASRTYFTLRWMTAYAIEAAIKDMAPYGIAHLEDNWRQHSKASTRPFKPFSEYPVFDELQIEPLPTLRGFRSLDLLARVTFLLWAVVVGFGFALLILAV